MRASDCHHATREASHDGVLPRGADLPAAPACGGDGVAGVGRLRRGRHVRRGPADHLPRRRDRALRARRHRGRGVPAGQLPGPVRLVRADLRRGRRRPARRGDHRSRSRCASASARTPSSAPCGRWAWLPACCCCTSRRATSRTSWATSSAASPSWPPKDIWLIAGWTCWSSACPSCSTASSRPSASTRSSPAREACTWNSTTCSCCA